MMLERSHYAPTTISMRLDSVLNSLMLGPCYDYHDRTTLIILSLQFYNDVMVSLRPGDRSILNKVSVFLILGPTLLKSSLGVTVGL